jgi:hypothetical protein
VENSGGLGADYGPGCGILERVEFDLVRTAVAWVSLTGAFLVARKRREGLALVAVGSMAWAGIAAGYGIAEWAMIEVVWAGISAYGFWFWGKS